MSSPAFLEPELPPVTNIRRYRYRPGDRIIVRINARISQEQGFQVQKLVAERLGMPSIGDILILSGGSDIKVMRNTSEQSGD